MGTPVGLDFGAVMAVGSAQGLDLELLAETLPEAENALLAGLSPDADDGDYFQSEDE